jgi:hypothetical protein
MKDFEILKVNRRRWKEKVEANQRILARCDGITATGTSRRMVPRSYALLAQGNKFTSSTKKKKKRLFGVRPRSS